MPRTDTSHLEALAVLLELELQGISSSKDPPPNVPKDLTEKEATEVLQVCNDALANNDETLAREVFKALVASTISTLISLLLEKFRDREVEHVLAPSLHGTAKDLLCDSKYWEITSFSYLNLPQTSVIEISVHRT